eukprot:61075-Pelagomonas_calceolata.AAC.4
MHLDLLVHGCLIFLCALCCSGTALLEVQSPGSGVAAVLILLRAGRQLQLLPSLDSLVQDKEALGLDLKQ